MLTPQETALVETLLTYGRSIPPAALFPTVVPEAQGFALSDPYAFAIATCLDRGTPTEIIWTIPYDMHELLGHLDPYKIRELSLAGLSRLFARLPRRPRYVHAAPRTVYELTEMVCDEIQGDASRIWMGKNAAAVKRTFLRIHGVGPGIASMAVLLIEKAFAVRFDDLDRPGMDIKPDTKTKRVLYRLGVSSGEGEGDAVLAARRLHPAFPGALDAPLWRIGRGYCRVWNPECQNCPAADVCQRRGVGAVFEGKPTPENLSAPGKPFPAPGVGNPAESASAPELVSQSPVRTIQPTTQPLSVDDLARMRRALLRAMDQLDPTRVERESPSARLHRLAAERRIPRGISAMMRSVIEFRNTAEYERTVPTGAESRALRATWEAITEWTQENGIALEPLG